MSLVLVVEDEPAVREAIVEGLGLEGYDVVTAGNGDVIAADGIGTCDITGVSFRDQSGLTINVGADSDSGVIELENAAHMSNESENGCQNAVFTIPVALSGASSNPGSRAAVRDSSAAHGSHVTRARYAAHSAANIPR